VSGYTVVLTGGVAAGKSSVARHFARRGVGVHDADLAAREVVAPGSEGLAAVVAAFGTGVLDADGALDRAAMRRRIFADAADRRALEAIVHPRVRQWLRERAEADRGPYSLLAIPLFAEHPGSYDWIDRVLVVDAPEAAQMARLVKRDGIDPALAERMLANQASRAQRLALADDVIDNGGDEAALEAAVEALHRRYLALAMG
jgi:dephospho-CoA kinase